VDGAELNPSLLADEGSLVDREIVGVTLEVAPLPRAYAIHKLWQCGSHFFADANPLWP
jgi:hypothetical protein